MDKLKIEGRRGIHSIALCFISWKYEIDKIFGVS